MNENKSLAEYGVEDNFVLHAVIKKGSPNERNNQQEIEEEKDERAREDVRANLIAILSRLRAQQRFNNLELEQDDIENNPHPHAYRARGRVRGRFNRGSERYLDSGWGGEYNSQNNRQGG